MKQKNSIIYCRVSTSKQSQEGESFATQEKICRSHSEKLGAKVIKVWHDNQSGRKEKRPIIDEILDFIQRNKGLVSYFIFRDIDRLTRAGSKQYYEIKDSLDRCGVELVESYGVIQAQKNTLDHLGFEYKWSKFSPSTMAETLKADMANDEVRGILTRLIGREIELVQAGFQIGNPNDGFRNEKILVDGKKKTIQVANPDRSHYFVKMFEMRASGRYPDSEIVDTINSMGFKTKIMNRWNSEQTRIIGKKGGKQLSIKGLHRFIQRPIYCGVICRKWTKYKAVKAKFEGLVSVKMFNEANRGKVFINESSDGELEILFDYKPIKDRRKIDRNNPLFPFKNVVKCNECKKSFLGSSPKGKSGKKFPTYHCGGKKRGHKYYGINKKEFENNVVRFIKGLDLSSEFLQTFEKSLILTWRRRQSEILKESKEIYRNVSELTCEKERVVEALIVSNSEVTKQALERKIERIEDEINKTKVLRAKSEVTEGEIQHFIKYAYHLLEHLDELLLDNTNMQRQQALFGLVFDELPTYKEILDGTPKLSLIFQQKKTSQKEKSQSVIRLGLEPRTISLKGCCSTN